MRAAWLALIFVATPVLAAPPPIVGGGAAEPGEFPAVGALSVVDGGMTSNCTGTLIAPTWVLTAAHCVDGMGSATVQFGVIDVGDSGAEIATAVQMIADPDHVPGTFGSNDLGLVELAAPITDITPTLVNFDAALAPVGVLVTTVGFGEPNLGMQDYVDNVSESCEPFGFDDTLLLCFPQTTTAGIGEGDSGGPSYASVRGHLLEVGVSSFTGGTPAIGGVQRTDAGAAFILAHVPELDCTQSTCPAGLACVDGTCTGATCSHDSDCGAMQVCFDGGCMAQPYGDNGLGATCESSSDCDSGECLIATSAKCVLDCSLGANDACPSGFSCTNPSDLGSYDPENGGGVCWPSNGGCDAGSGGATVWFGLALLAVVRRRRIR